MANGDDGYVDGGGGGSVWWEVGVSEGKIINSKAPDYKELFPDNTRSPHRPAKGNHGMYTLSGHDSYRESTKTDNEQGYFEITIVDATQISRIAFDANGQTLRLYLPIVDSETPEKQFSVKWGLRQRIPSSLGWTQLKAALQSIGVISSAV